jgi:superfamily II DNA or RNA helicase
VEAPNGSGKTLIGMLCIEDWLDELGPGQSVLVLVPTVNYQQQWVAELCLKPVGLQLQPHLVQAGTPAALDRSRAAGALPAVLLVTYAALARLASGAGRGGFDATEVERFLQHHAVRHVILDEVHKVVADPLSPTARAARVLVEWLRDGSLSSLIGLSATVTGLEPQLSALGLELACALPPTELVVQGWVAPFAELAVPFGWSARERRIVVLMDDYRAALLEYLGQLGGPWLRERFAAIPIEERVRACRQLGMYARDRDADWRIRRRIAAWEAGGAVSLDEVQLVATLQVLLGWSDGAMLEAAGQPGVLPRWAVRFDVLRSRLAPLLPAGPFRRRVEAPGFGTMAPGLGGLAPGRTAGDNRPSPPSRASVRANRDGLASTFTGLYLGLRDWSRQAGEGRIETIRAVIAAERRSRRVPGVIVFDVPAPLRPADGLATPGYRGAGGLFTELLDDAASVPIAALASAIYLPDVVGEPLHARVADWILETIVRREQGRILEGLVLATAGLGGPAAAALHAVVDAGFDAYAAQLRAATVPAPRAFRCEVIRPLRAEVRRRAHGPGARRALAMLALDRHHPQLRAVLRATTEYARIARAFREAPPIAVIRADGTSRTIRALQMPAGERRQRMFDLTARIVDAPDLPVNVIVVTSWARTGWNVTSPNVLIDATATRDVIAWRQLRGRAMRPVPDWPVDAQRLLERLQDGPPGDGRAVSDVATENPSPDADLAARVPLSRLQRALVQDALPARDDRLRPWFERLAAGTVQPEDLPADLRGRAAAILLLAHNKVAHVYELVRGHGSGRQVRYDRGRERWERIEAIAGKHRREWSVRPTDGAWLAGPEHAPLIVADDPRSDTPAELEETLVRELAPGDEIVVRGWLQAAGQV